jgi:hypothetical protein
LRLSVEAEGVIGNIQVQDSKFVPDLLIAEQSEGAYVFPQITVGYTERVDFI